MLELLPFMNIVMFTDAYWPRVNGVTVSVDSYSRALIKAGHQVLIVCSFYPEGLNAPVYLLRDRDEEEGPKIVRVPSLPVKKARLLPHFHLLPLPAAHPGEAPDSS